jgi:hypothetical protein
MLLSSGNAAGVVVFEEGPPGGVVISVHVTAFHQSTGALNLVEACHLANETGLQLKVRVEVHP